MQGTIKQHRAKTFNNLIWHINIHIDERFSFNNLTLYPECICKHMHDALAYFAMYSLYIQPS